MKPQPTHIESMAVRKAQFVGAQQVRYRVYQSPTEFIAVIAESALLAIRIAGISNPYKVVRDLPTSATALEKGKIDVTETSETVALPTTPIKEQLFHFQETSTEDAAPFIEMTLKDIHKNRKASIGVLSRKTGIDSFGIAQDAPTLNRPTPSRPEIQAPPATPNVAAADPLPKLESGILSQEDIAKLLGDV